MSFVFENLDVYKFSIDWAEDCDQLLQNLKGSVSPVVSDQLSRASLSIPLNIAEGNGRWHKPDKRNFFWIARGSLFECVPLIEILKRKNHISEATYLEFRSRLTVIGKMLTNLIKAHE